MRGSRPPLGCGVHRLKAAAQEVRRRRQTDTEPETRTDCTTREAEAARSIPFEVLGMLGETRNRWAVAVDLVPP
jgi:hypothetical protein